MPSFTPRQLILLVLLTIVWGLNWPVMKLGVQHFPPLSFRMVSMWIGLPILAIFVASKGLPLTIPRSYWGQLAKLTLFNMVLWHCLIIIAIPTLSSGRAAILGYTMPIFSAVFGSLFFKDKLGPRAWAGVGAAFAGVLLLLWHEVGALGGFDRGQRARVHAALAQVGLDGFARQPVDALSGGQLQRTLFARLLLQDAPLMLLDEPFVGIDQRTTGELLTLLHGWHAEGRTVLAVLHDLQQVSQSFPQTLLLSRELIGWGATAAVLTPAALARARQMPDAPDAHAPLCDGLPPAATDAGAPQAPERGHEYRHGHGHDPHPHGHAHRPQPDGAKGTP